MAWMRAIGLMSGTSMDAVDVALIETDGTAVRLAASPNGGGAPAGAARSYPYSEADRALLRAALDAGQALPSDVDRRARPGILGDAEALITRRHAEAVARFLAEEGLDPASIDLVGFHGQTVLHRPEAKLTIQIGDGQALADAIGIPVVFDLRAADVAAGGQGAPLVPVFHRALAESCGYDLPLAILNIGGVANVSLIGPNDILGFDTGPGNALLDDLMQARVGKPCDENGEMAARGVVDMPILAWLLAHPYFAQRPPKSLDRKSFAFQMVGALPTEHAAATLTAFTAASAARALDWTSMRPRTWIVGGGGAKNSELMRMLRRELAVDVVAADDIGWSGDGLEAQAFAFLAARHLAGLPITFPGTTGVAEGMRGGVLARPGAT
jgi:anhydro-N-acetylmuramic acid kinase